MRVLVGASMGALAVLGHPAFVDIGVATAKAKAMASSMTIADLLGQMNQIEVGAFTYDDWDNDGQKTINSSLVEDYAKHNVGAYLNLVPNLAEWGRPLWNASQYRALVATLQDAHVNRSSTRIPILYGFDSTHGANYIANATLFPQPINTGATFNVELAGAVGMYTGRDTLAGGMPWVYSPMLEVIRHKHWPRMYESYNEDIVAVSELGRAYIAGMQSQGVAACFKHFIGYSDPTDGNDRTDVVLSKHQVLNYFVPPFKAAIEAGVLSGMGTYVGLNGVPMAANNVTSNLLLRRDLNFSGLMVTDWGEMYLLHDPRKLVPSELEATAVGMNRTTYDMVMTPHDMSFIKYGRQLVSTGRLARARLEQAVSRILTLKFVLNLFENPLPGADLVDLVGDNASRAAAIVVAQESIVLLKNDDHVLPLGRPPTTTTTNHTMSLFLTGPSIDNIGLQCGGWSLAWQGIDGNAAFPHGQSIRHAINATVRAWNLTAASTDTIAANANGIPRLDHVNVTFLQAMDIYGNFTSNESLQEAIALASTATHTIVALGERNYAEQFGNSDPQALPPAFVTYVKALATTKTRIILVVVAGRPRILNGLAELCHAVLWAGLPCEAGGQAIADVLFGRVNPSAKLPFTYPKTDGHVNLATPYYYRSNDVGSTACVRGGKEFSTDCATEYPFGAGLSYTTFDYTNMQVTPTALTSDAAAVVVTASVVVTNTGRVAGKEVVMLFVSPPPSLHNETETRLLKRFAKIWLAPGESTVVRFDITPSDWGFYHNEFGTGLRKTAPSGSYVVHFKPTTNCADPSTSLCQTVRWENRSGAAAAWNAWHWVVAVLAWVAAL
ncbi:hypothetical protein DYB32_008080 [Aphanomyces invadans]|uniref:beta-glucosidase n=1 Tax=Aphanomyces invadans TaxID=157072 RepID=A0A3R6ZKQ9_9STRA|nr:hypothetical protein DYB32_008080 [Aphanomyces invadans]